MWIENKTYKKDLEAIINDCNIEWDKLKNRSILITGATGLIGSNLVNALLYANKELGIDCTVLALIRNTQKADKMFGAQQDSGLQFVIGDVLDEIICKEKIDYIVHTASQTASKQFVEDPVNTIDIALRGTKNVLDLAKKKNILSMVYLSTMEVYGRPQDDEKISEDHPTDLNTTEVRNCYPISKRMCENMCVCYDVNAKIARLTQTFGPGVSYNDERVFAQFARCAIEKKDIILRTEGKTKRCYLYTADAVRAILTILLKGKNEQAYNVANENTYCSISEMAQSVANKCAKGSITVKYELDDDIGKYGYAPTLCMNLDTSKVRKLGWEPKNSLITMYNNLISVMSERLEQ